MEEKILKEKMFFPFAGTASAVVDVVVGEVIRVVQIRHFLPAFVVIFVRPVIRFLAMWFQRHQRRENGFACAAPFHIASTKGQERNEKKNDFVKFRGTGHIMHEILEK
jgi:hypothetical protein